MVGFGEEIEWRGRGAVTGEGVVERERERQGERRNEEEKGRMKKKKGKMKKKKNKGSRENAAGCRERDGHPLPPTGCCTIFL